MIDTLEKPTTEEISGGITAEEDNFREAGSKIRALVDAEVAKERRDLVEASTYQEDPKDAERFEHAAARVTGDRTYKVLSYLIPGRKGSRGSRTDRSKEVRVGGQRYIGDASGDVRRVVRVKPSRLTHLGFGPVEVVTSVDREGRKKNKRQLIVGGTKEDIEHYESP